MHVGQATKRHRILYIVTSGHIGGPQTHLIHCSEWFKEEFDIEICAGSDGYFADEVRKMSIPLHVFPVLGSNRPSLKDPWAVKELTGIIRRFAPDILSCHSTKGGFLGRIVGSMTRVPVVFTAHGWAFRGPWSRRVIAPPIERQLARWSKRIICVSEYDRKLALKYKVGDSKKLVTIHNGVPLLGRDVRANPGREGKVVLTMVARFAAPKDHALLIRALSMLKEERNYEVWFVGSGKMEELAKRMAGQLGLDDKIRFLGQKKEKDILFLLARSNVFLLVSHWEGFPRSILEAMRAGLPVISSDVGGVREAVVDGKTGFLVPDGIADVLREKLAILMHNPSLRAEMGSAGCKRYVENFTLDKMLTATREIYYDVIGDRHSSFTGITGTRIVERVP